MLLSEGSADTFMQLTKKLGADTFAGHQQRQVSWCWCCPPADGGAGASWRCHETEGGCRWWLETPGGRTSRWTTAKLPFLWSPLLRFCQQHFQTKSQLLRIRNIKYILIFTQPGRLCFLPPPHLHLTKTMTSNVSVWRSFTRGNKININPEKCLLTLNAVQTLRIV